MFNQYDDAPIMAASDASGIRIKDDIYWIGGDDMTAGLFEGSFPIPEGVSYNSYVIMDEKTCLLDTCDMSIAPRFWKNLRQVLDGRPLDYIVINHMEPDHGACIMQVLDSYPDVTVVGNTKTFDMLNNFYHIVPKNRLEVKEGDLLCLGEHTLKFYIAVMIHWPEVKFSYDVKDRILFSADAFGTFKTLSGALYADEVDFDRDYLDEAQVLFQHSRQIRIQGPGRVRETGRGQHRHDLSSPRPDLERGPHRIHHGEVLPLEHLRA